MLCVKGFSPAGPLNTFTNDYCRPRLLYTAMHVWYKTYVHDAM